MINPGQNCIGCFACYSTCPQKAISMVEDDEGFLVPNINQNKCSNCGICESVCPLNFKNTERKPLAVFAAKHSNEETKLLSSSGGMFSAFAERIIAANGVIFGAKFNENMEVVHGFTETIEGLADFRGSKYVQSKIGDTYLKAKDFLDCGRKVLFTGTPCQTAGLKSFLQKDYENLLTIDLICFGVPSPKLWKEYLESIISKYKDKIPDLKVTKAFFRNKRNGWEKYNFSLCVYSEYLNKEIELFSDFISGNKFLQYFLKGLTLRNSCYNCQFRSLKSGSDLTIGDFWGIKNVLPDFYDQNGVSLVLLNSEKGKSFFNAVSSIISQETVYEKVLQYNQMIEKNADKPERRRDFYKNTDNRFLLKNDSCNFNPLKTGVLAPPWQDNYGTILQEYALVEILKQLGHSPVFVSREYSSRYFRISLKTRIRAFLRQFVKKMILFRGDSLAYISLKKSILANQLYIKKRNTFRCFDDFIDKKIYPKTKVAATSEDLETNTKDLNVIIVGSDQVWAPEASREKIYDYFCEFLRDSSIKAIAYAPSFGFDNWRYTREQTSRCRDLLKKFESVSVREADGVNKCQKYFNRQATHVLDPTMLLTKDFYEKNFVDVETENDNDGFVFSYILDESEERNTIINKISKLLKKETKILNYSGSIKNGLLLPKMETWLSNFSRSDFIFTDSFHGTALSIVFNRPFVTFFNKKRGNARFLSLLETFNLKDRLITSASELTEEKILAPIDWNKVNIILELERDKSLNFLKNSLAEIVPLNKKPRYSLKRFIGKVLKKIGLQQNDQN